MTTNLIKIDGYWIVAYLHDCEDYDWTNFNISDFTNSSSYLIASQNPEHNLPTITFSDEVIAEWGKKLGIVDVEKLAFIDANKVWNNENTLENEQRELNGHIIGFQEGYKKCSSDNADKVFTLEDINKAIEMARETENSMEVAIKQINNEHYEPSDFLFSKEQIIQSLTKEEYFCELVMEIKCPFDFTSRCTMDRCNCEKQPKKTSNSVKVIKIWK